MNSCKNLFVFVCVLAVFLLVSCGEDKNDVTSDTPSPSTDTATVENNEDVAEGASNTTNSPPRILSIKINDNTIYSGADAQGRVMAEDPDGDSFFIDYRWKVNNQEVAGIIDPLLPATHFNKGDNVVLEAMPRDSFGSGEWFSSPEHQVVNGAPNITSRPPSSLSGDVYTYDVKATDPDNDALVFSLDEGPEGLVIDGQSGRMSWTPTEGMTGEFSVVIRVTDPEGAAATQSFTVEAY